MLPTNFVAFSDIPFGKHNLPCENTWVWNQSNGKVVVPLDGNRRSVTIQKMNPRRKKECTTKPPSYKIWIYIITQQNLPDLHFLWCEKGTEPQPGRSLNNVCSIQYGNNNLNVKPMQSFTGGIATSIGTVYPNQVTTADLSFLRPFMDDTTAVELGWA